MKNKYLKHTHLSERQFLGILAYWCQDLIALDAASLLKINRNTINRIYGILRERACALSIAESDHIEDGVFECDESYFGAHRVRGKRGRGALGKTPVFGILKRGGLVFVTVVRNCSKNNILPIIKGHVLTGSTIHTDGWRSYDGLIVNGYDHYRIHHHENEFARGKNHVNGIESFWSYAKRRLAKFNGINGTAFPIHLKECEFRFNHRKEDLYSYMLSSITKAPLI
jgi:transposase-like protein